VAGWTADLSWIAPDLAVGAEVPAGAVTALAREHGVGAVVDLRAEFRPEPAAFERCGVTLLHLPTPDMAGVSQAMLDEGVAFARQAAADGRRLLIHCQHGIGRSATLALCVLADRGCDPLTALRQAKDARECVSPSRAQYEAWMAWLARRAPAARRPSFHEFGCIAYRHLAQQA
jgi:protein-tyrosine phosphatase